jgi:hypothetical protein
VDPNNINVQLTLLGAAGGQISWLLTPPGTIDIFTFNAAGVATDEGFSIVVYDLT